MKNKDDSFSAFPLPLGDEQINERSAGMSLRDYFAAKAMQGFSASPSMIDSNDLRAIEYVAAASYAMADAMLAERAK